MNTFSNEQFFMNKNGFHQIELVFVCEITCVIKR